jgi:hypothetical protein
VKLPLNVFQVLGVSPGASANNVLMQVGKRLEACPYSGLSMDTMSKRQVLLKEFSQFILCNNTVQNAVRSPISEPEYFLEDLSIPSESYATAALSLLLEAGMQAECIILGTELIRRKEKEYPRKDQTLSDLTHLIGYATIEQAEHFKSSRHYELSAQKLERGLSILNNSENPQIISKINEKLEDILPFRILDLLSRSTEEQSRSAGLALLQKLVEHRGGLDCVSNKYIDNSEFKAFFRQIRYYLTVQEQIDLFNKWSSQNSKTACFLLGISLVASGFSQRKPQRLVEALHIFQKLGSTELNQVFAFIYLLLGRVNEAKQLFTSLNVYSNSPSTTSMTYMRPEENLGELCDCCREWLTYDVLEGYRDIEKDADLESYFNDRDVTIFIEDSDRSENNYGLLQGLTKHKRNYHSSQYSHESSFGDPIRRNDFSSKESYIDRIFFSSVPRLITIILDRRRRVLALIIGSALLIYLFSFFAQKKTDLEQKNAKVTTESSDPIKLQSVPKKVHGPILRQVPSPDLSQEGMIDLLSRWLMIKKNALAGLPIPEMVSQVASPEAITSLKLERSENQQKGQILYMDVNVLDVEILSKTRDTITFAAKLSYQDKRTGRTGETIDKTPKHVFTKTYRLVNNGQNWRIQ